MGKCGFRKNKDGDTALSAARAVASLSLPFVLLNNFFFSTHFGGFWRFQGGWVLKLSYFRIQRKYENKHAASSFWFGSIDLFSTLVIIYLFTIFLHAINNDIEVWLQIFSFFNGVYELALE